MNNTTPAILPKMIAVTFGTDNSLQATPYGAGNSPNYIHLA